VIITCLGPGPSTTSQQRVVPPRIFPPSRTVTPHDDSLGSDGPRFSVHLDRRAAHHALRRADSARPRANVRPHAHGVPCPEHGTEKCRAHPLAFVVLWTLHYLPIKRRGGARGRSEVPWPYKVSLGARRGLERISHVWALTRVAKSLDFD